VDLPLYQVDAFADRLFTGNPAAVVPLPGPDALPDALLQAIAAENNLAETAFLHPAQAPAEYGLRWFTPACEVDLCGHATLAAAFVVFSHLEPDAAALVFHTRSGPLRVRREGDGLTLDFPAVPAAPAPLPPDLEAGLGLRPLETLLAMDYLAVLDSEAAVRALAPDMAALARLPVRGIIVTARGTDCDFVSRFFAPASGVPEDPVTGSAHCTLAPYWAPRLSRTRLLGRQVGPRGGEVRCTLQGDRVELWGRAVPYLEGRIRVAE